MGVSLQRYTRHSVNCVQLGASELWPPLLRPILPFRSGTDMDLKRHAATWSIETPDIGPLYLLGV